jgi:DNA-directed RNA polymerase specialized sigma24 family protein
MLEPPDDAALIERSRDDPEAFAVVYDRHAALLHRYVARRLGDAAADDVVADTFLDAFRGRHRYDLSVGDARPWLYGIAANLIGKRSRAEVRMLRAYARSGADPVLNTAYATGYADVIAEADSRIASAALRRKLATALAGLPAGDRDVLLMVAWPICLTPRSRRPCGFRSARSVPGCTVPEPGSAPRSAAATRLPSMRTPSSTVRRLCDERP